MRARLANAMSAFQYEYALRRPSANQEGLRLGIKLGRRQTKETCVVLIEDGAGVSGMLRLGGSGLLAPRVRCGVRVSYI